MLLSIQCRVYCSLAVTHLAWHGHATGPLLLLLLLLCIMAINPFCRCVSISIVNNNNPFVTHFNRANSVIATSMSIEHLDGDDGTLLLHINTFPVSPVVSVRCVSPTTTFWTLTWKASQHSTWWVVWVRAVHRYHSVFRHWWYMLFTLITFGNRFLSFCHLRLRMRIDFDPIHSAWLCSTHHSAQCFVPIYRRDADIGLVRYARYDGKVLILCSLSSINICCGLPRPIA